MSIFINKEIQTVIFCTFGAYLFYITLWPILTRRSNEELLKHKPIKKNKHAPLLQDKENILKYIFLSLPMAFLGIATYLYSNNIVTIDRRSGGTTSGFEHFIYPASFLLLTILITPFKIRKMNEISMNFRKNIKYFVVISILSLLLYNNDTITIHKSIYLIFIFLTSLLVTNSTIRFKVKKIDPKLQSLGLAIIKTGIFEPREYIYRTDQFNIFIFPATEVGGNNKGGSRAIVRGIRFSFSPQIDETEITYPKKIKNILMNKKIKLIGGVKCWDIKGEYNDERIYEEFKTLI